MMPHTAKKEVALPVTLAEASALDRLVAMVKANKGKPYCGDLGKFERELRERLNEVGRELVGDELSKADVDASAVQVGATSYRRVLGAAETYITTFGPVSVYRTLYKDRDDPLERAVAMLDLRVGMVAGLWTPEAAKQATWVVAQMTPGLAEEMFRRVGNMTPSKSSLDRLPKVVSATWEENRKAFEVQIRKTLVVPEEATAVAMSLDGVLVPMTNIPSAGKEEETKGDKATGGPEGYREVGCATVTFYDEAGEMLSAIRMARMPQEHKADLKEMLRAEMAVVYEQRPDLQVIKVADAARDNWTFLSKLRVGKEVVDYYHATEHLNVALQSAYGAGTGEQRRKCAELADVLLTEQDGVDRVIATLRELEEVQPDRQKKRKAILIRELKFFTRNKGRMRYAALRAANLPVGSGPQEAACKTVAAQRMKQSGMRWGEEGGQAILTTRAWTQSGRFDDAWALLAATYQVEVTVMTNVVDLASRRNRAKRRSG